jgi:hypothetical protein
LFARTAREASPRADTVNVAAEVRRLIASREPADSPSDEIVFIE